MNEQLISVIDLTRLEDDAPGEREKIIALCEKAVKHHVAAVCVYPRYLDVAKKILQDSDVKLATVANFPAGMHPLEAIERDIKKSIDDGAQEIDLVFPYQDYLHGEREKALAVVRASKKACANALLKVILETGVISSRVLPEMATDVIDAGADFLKTSTGKVPVGATPEAVKILLEVIQQHHYKVGLKISGGVRKKEDAILYWNLAEQSGLPMDKNHFRIGASSLLDELV